MTDHMPSSGETDSGHYALSDLGAEVDRFERELRAAGLKEASVETYVKGARQYVRWLAGEYEPSASQD